MSLPQLSPRQKQVGVGIVVTALLAWLLLLLLRGRTGTRGAADEAAPKVHQVTAENLDEFVAQPDVVLMAMAHWCVHCVHMKPHFFRAAANAPAGGPRFGIVDAHREKGVAQKLGLEGFPTIYRFRNGERTTYDGGFDHKALLEFAA